MKHKLWSRAASVCTALSLLIGSGSILPESSPTKVQTVHAADAQIEDFAIGDVTMLDPYSTNAFALELSYLLSFDTERLLVGFRENAKLNTNGAKRYGGWENTLIAGHTVGHYLTALAQAYQNPSITDAQRNDIMAKIKALVDGMKVCQQNSKGKPGFLWAGQIKNQNNVEQQFDLVQQGKTNIIEEAWVPWYTMHKLIQGLVDVFNATGYAPAKEVGSGLGDWTYNRCLTWNDATHRTVLSIEYGGINGCLYELYAITGKESHAVAAHYFDETELHEKVLKGGTNVLTNRHANTTIPKFVGALKRYTVLHGKTIGGQTVDASIYVKYAEAFWENVTTNHTYITGGNSEWEHFGSDNVLDKERTNCNCETCNSYNMLKLSRELYKITGEKKYMDYYEGTYYNSILSSQNPETGMTTYFQPMATGYFKVYGKPFDHFWCCTGSGMENFTKLGDTMYMHNGNTLYVNMYQSSKLNWKDQNVTITQDSTIPNGISSKFTIEGSGSLDLRFRIPDWKAGNMTITLNGEKCSYKNVNDYAQVTGDFKSGDVIEVTIPMEVRAYNLPDGNTTYGFKYGPIVLSAELGKENMQTGSTGMWVTIPKDKVVASENITLSKEGQSVAAFMMDINEYMVKDANSLKFTLTGTNTKLTFTPHYLQYQQRYGIYWKFFSNGTVSDSDLPRAKTTVVDTVQPGYGQYEGDNLHQMTAFNAHGVTNDSTYRYVTDGGYFSYRMAVDTSAPFTILQVTFRKADNGKTIRIRVGDAILYAEKLNYEGSSATYNVKVIVPEDVLERNVKNVDVDGVATDVIDVTFSADDGKESAKVCDFIYMTAVKPIYDYDTSVAYFVDCGDHDQTTTSGSDKFGYFNSRTEQLYGEDSVTGAKWGLIDDATDKYNGASKSKGIYTANTWPNEFTLTDGQDKKASFRYTKNQYENNIDRHLDYGFTLPNGTYTVEMCFSDPWSCSKNPTIYANYGKDNQSIVAENVAIDGNGIAKGTVKVTDGTLTLNVRTQDKAINLNYILIKFADTEGYSVVGKKGDVNLDGVVDDADIVLLNEYLLTKESFIGDQVYASDMIVDVNINAFDLAILKREIVQTKS
ncbi:MAG: glycoside hydrolase family 127 protein [Oscillospiraceae bacterium]|nr:glycoside hydrolase family 127 protein [Oscillospiraceae bacterium]